MAYSQGGKIDAADYNSLVSTINTVWSSSGPGQIGYGQTALSTVAANGVVTATQWSTLINTLNNLRNHQSGTGSGISAVTSGAKINHLSTLETQATLVNTNAALYATQGSTVTGTNYARSISSTTGSSGTIQYRTVFSSADAARYFFRAGGQLNLVLSTSGSNGSGSSSSLARLITGLGGAGIRRLNNTGRTGTGVTLNINNTSIGFYSDFAGEFGPVPRQVVSVSDNTASYTTAYANINIITLTPSGLCENADLDGATEMEILVDWGVPDKTWDDTIGITINSRVDIVYPETTYLTSSWGTPTINYAIT